MSWFLRWFRPLIFQPEQKPAQISSSNPSATDLEGGRPRHKDRGQPFALLLNERDGLAIGGYRRMNPGQPARL